MTATSFGPGPRILGDFTSSPFEPALPPVTRLEDVDVTDPNLYIQGDPHGTWKLLREQAPVFWHEKGTLGTEFNGFWVGSRYSDFIAVTRDAATFSNCESALLDTPGAMFNNTISVMDPPRHTRYRRLVQRYFTPKAVGEWREAVARVVAEALDGVCEQGSCDFAAELALRLPVPATAEFMGLTAEETDRLQTIQEILHGAGTPEALMEYTTAGLEFFGTVVAARKADPGDGMIGSIITGEPDGAPLDDGEILFYLWLLFIGGLDSTVHALSGSMLSLFHHPDELARLTADPGLLDSAVEELLRWTTVSQHLKRQATKDTELGGQKIAAGDYVCVFDPSANRDEMVWEDPFRFDVGRFLPGRDAATIVTFGHGPHTCPGLHFARLEMKLFFGELLRRMPDITQAGPAVRAPAFSILLPPIEHLPVTFTPSKPEGAAAAAAATAR